MNPLFNLETTLRKLTEKALITLALVCAPHVAMSESRLAPGAVDTPLIPTDSGSIDPIAMTPVAATGVVVTAVLVARASVAQDLGEVCDSEFDIDPTGCPKKPAFPHNPKF